MRTSYYPVTFTDAQWATMRKTFPTGVCDWSKPGVDQQATIPWQTYQRGVNGEVVFGGEPLGPAPAGSAGGWTSKSFSDWQAAIPGGKSGAVARDADAAKQAALVINAGVARITVRKGSLLK